LRNLLERASLLADGEDIEPRHLLDDGDHEPPLATAAGPNFEAEWLTLDERERRYLTWALTHHQGDRLSLARRLGISERTLFRKIQSM
jgi:two-component system response regulator HydG